MTDEMQQSVLLTTFTSKKKRYKVFFHQGKVIWDNEKPPSAQKTVPIEDVISVEHNFIPPRHPLDDPRLDANNFVIHFAERGPKKTWKYNSMMFGHTDQLQVSSWVKTLQNHLQNFTQRPKKVLVFVNPFCGRKNAMQVYEKYAKPIFNIAKIDVTLNVSQRKDQIRDFISYHNLDMYDAVVCVGGDGTVSELFNGLVIRECRMQDIDIDNANIDLPKLSLPVGVIPSGSTDTIAYCLHGTGDATTAVLHIIFGDSLGLDLVSVYNENRFLKVFASVLSYGYLGDVIYHSDRFRWMGPKRYDYSGFKKIITNTGYKGEISVLFERNELTESRCFENCAMCLEKTTDGYGGDSISKNDADLMWKTVTGKYFMVSGANISCACARSPNGISPYSHIGDGNLHLVLVHHTNLINNVKLLLRMVKKTGTINDLPFIEIHKGREFHFRSIDKPSRWNCDGEVQSDPDIHAKVRCQLLKVFSRGNPEIVVKPTTSCCGKCC